jgi:hypothetical protein
MFRVEDATTAVVHDGNEARAELMQMRLAPYETVEAVGLRG